MRLEIVRFQENEYQTLSKFIIIDEWNCEVAQGYMLELPDNNNESNISRIYAGEYHCKKRYSEKYGNHFHVLNVVGRLYILIHHGNYYTNTRGCILPGEGLVDINGDGLKDVTSSKRTMDLLNEILPDEFILEIKNQIV
jgi:hypothetical protein